MISTGAKIERLREEAIKPEADRIVEVVEKGSIKSSQTGYISDADLNNAQIDTDFQWDQSYRRYMDYTISSVNTEKSIPYINEYIRTDIVRRLRGRLISPTTLRIYNNVVWGSNNYRISNLTWRVIEFY